MQDRVVPHFGKLQNLKELMWQVVKEQGTVMINQMQVQGDSWALPRESFLWVMCVCVCLLAVQMKELLKLYYLIKITRQLRKDLSHLDDFIGSAKLYGFVSCSLPRLKATAGRGRWKRWPGVSSKLQNSNPDLLHLWNYRSLGTCLMKVFCLFESVSFFFLQCCWLVWDSSHFEVSGLSSAVVKCQGKNNGGEVIVSWAYMDQRPVYICECMCSSFSVEEKLDYTSHGMGVGKRYRSGMRGSRYQYAQIYIDKCIQCACQNRVFSLR